MLFRSAALVVKQAERKLRDLRLLHDSVEFSPEESAKRIRMLEKELNTAKREDLPSAFSLVVIFVPSCS